MTRFHPPRIWPGLRLAALLLLVPGCEPIFGPPHVPTVCFSGRVLWRGQPITRGWLEIAPTEGTLGHLTSARLKPDGTFRADRAPVGTVAIRMVGLPMIRSRDPAEDRYLLSIRQRSLIARTIPPGGLTGCVIDLDHEAQQATRPAPVSK